MKLSKFCFILVDSNIATGLLFLCVLWNDGLSLSDEPGLVAKICQYVGIEIREEDVYQFGKQEIVEDNQIQI